MKKDPEIIPEEMVEVQDMRGRPSRGPGAPPPPPPRPRIIINNRGCFLQSLNCGCGCLSVLLMLAAIVFLLSRC